MQQEMNEKIPPICNWRGFPVVARVGKHSSFSQFRDNFGVTKFSFRKNESLQMSLSQFLKWHEFYSQKYFFLDSSCCTVSRMTCMAGAEIQNFTAVCVFENNQTQTNSAEALKNGTFVT